MLKISASHRDTRWQLDGVTFAVMAEGDAFADYRVGGDAANGFYAIAPNFGCGKSARTAQDAIRSLLTDNGATMTACKPVPAIAAARTYRTEFPDFPAADMPPIPATWTDESWHNETCPHFIVMGTDLHVFVDYAEAGQREHSDTRRFSVHDREISPVFDTDSWPETLAYVGAWETVTNGLSLAEWIYEELRENRLSRLAAIYLKAENDSAAKPCADVRTHLAAVLKASEIAAKWVGRIGMGFHPDTRGADYVPAFSAEDVAQYDNDMAELLGTPDCDPYALALAAMEAGAR